MIIAVAVSLLFLYILRVCCAHKTRFDGVIFNAMKAVK